MLRVAPVFKKSRPPTPAGRAWRFFCLLCAAMLAAQSALAHPDLEEQIARLTINIALQPDHPDLLLQRADLYRRHGQFDDALKDIARAERISTNVVPLTLDRARVLCEAGRAAEAVAEVQVLISRQTNHMEALIIRARGEAQLGHKEAAVLDFTTAIGHSPAPAPDLFLERAHLLAELGRLDEAVRGLDVAISNSHFASPLQLTAIEYERRRGTYDSALTRTDSLTARYPVKEPWLTLRAEILEQAGRTREAAETFQHVLAGIEKYPVIRRGLDLTKQLEQRAQQGLARTRSKAHTISKS